MTNSKEKVREAIIKAVPGIETNCYWCNRTGIKDDKECFKCDGVGKQYRPITFEDVIIALGDKVTWDYICHDGYWIFTDPESDRQNTLWKWKLGKTEQPDEVWELLEEVLV